MSSAVSTRDPSVASTVSSRANWVPNRATSQCMLCATNFGAMTWKHHCRFCGKVVCAACSEFRVPGVPGFEGKSRVCSRCFYNELAIVVVWHSFFSYHTKFLASMEEARQVYDDCPTYASRLIMRMKSGVIVDAWFKNEEWRSKIVNRANCQRSQSLSIPSVAGGPSAPATTQRSALMVLLFRPTPTGPFFHTWDHVRRETDLPGTIEKMKSIVSLLEAPQAVLLRDDLSVHYVHNTHEPTADADLAAEAKRALGSVKLAVVWRHDLNFHTRRTTFSQLPTVVSAVDLCDPVVIVDEVGMVVFTRGCDDSDWQESLAKTAGQAVMADIPALAVALVVGSNAVCFDNIYIAQQALISTMKGMLFALARPDSSAATLVHYKGLNPTVTVAEAQRTALINLHQHRLTQQQQPAEVTIAAAPSNARNGVQLDCGICCEPYNGERRRPCICGSCGNTACEACLKQLTSCPSCRQPLPRDRLPPNVAIMQLLENTN